MLENIKSVYFIKIIFSYVFERNKLKIIKYNKNLQNKIDITLLNYKIYSGNYIIYEKNGKGKEYRGYNDKLEFEGVYKNEKRNGKGIEFHSDGKIKFEGEYLNGKRSGKGKEYYFNGKLVFEGEYLNGKRNGKGKKFNHYNGKLEFEGEFINDNILIGKKYDEDGNIILEIKKVGELIREYDFINQLLIFEGEYLNGKRNGKGKKFYNDQLIFEGEYINGKKNGIGKEYDYHDGHLIFEGEYLNDNKWNGVGYDSFKNIIYELKEGKGYIKEYDYNILVFEGEYLNGRKNGKGKEYNNSYGISKLIFEGEYINGLKHGKGKKYDYRTGNLFFDGEYLYNKKMKGKEYINNRLEYEGEYLFYKKYNGKGYDKNGNLIYELNNGCGKVKEYNEKVNFLYNHIASLFLFFYHMNRNLQILICHLNILFLFHSIFDFHKILQ